MSDVEEVVNIGSEEMVTINELAMLIADISGKDIHIRNIKGPVGVNGRNSDNTLFESLLEWSPSEPLRDGMKKTYYWIESEFNARK